MPTGYDHFLREVYALQQSRGDSYTEAFKLAKLIYPGLYQDYLKTINGGVEVKSSEFANTKPETGTGPATVRIAQVVAERMSKFNEDYVTAFKKVMRLRPELFEGLNP